MPEDTGVVGGALHGTCRKQAITLKCPLRREKAHRNRSQVLRWAYSARASPNERESWTKVLACLTWARSGMSATAKSYSPFRPFFVHVSLSSTRGRPLESAAWSVGGLFFCIRQWSGSKTFGRLKLTMSKLPCVGQCHGGRCRDLEDLLRNSLATLTVQTMTDS